MTGGLAIAGRLRRLSWYPLGRAGLTALFVLLPFADTAAHDHAEDPTAEQECVFCVATSAPAVLPAGPQAMADLPAPVETIAAETACEIRCERAQPGVRGARAPPVRAF